jgi:hypothetical protein
MSHFPPNTRFQSLTSTPKLPGKDFADDLPGLVPEVWLTPRYGHVKRTDRRIQLELDRARYVSQMPRLIEIFSLYVPISKMRIALCRLLQCLAAVLFEQIFQTLVLQRSCNSNSEQTLAQEICFSYMDRRPASPRPEVAAAFPGLV